MKDIDELIIKLNESLGEIQTAKVEIQNKPEMVDLMKNAFEEHIDMYYQLLEVNVKINGKKIAVADVGNRVEEFRLMLTERFPLMI